MNWILETQKAIRTMFRVMDLLLGHHVFSMQACIITACPCRRTNQRDPVKGQALSGRKDGFFLPHTDAFWFAVCGLFYFGGQQRHVFKTWGLVREMYARFGRKVYLLP